MGLESVLKPMKFVDEQIHRQYEKLGAKLDKKSPKARAYTAFGFWLAGAPFIYFLHTPVPGIAGGAEGMIGAVEGMVGVVKGTIGGVDLSLNIYACTDGLNSQENTSETKVKDHQFIDLYLKINEAVRSPLFLTGVGFAGKGIYDLVNGFVNNEPIPGESIENLLQGLGMISVSSSMFLKDKNPKLLQKEPFWKKAYNWAKDKVGSLAPQPIPQPVPVQAYYTLDSYV